MTLEEAIKYLEAGKSGVIFNLKAVQLGIEALKLLLTLRRLGVCAAEGLIPGETEAGK